MTKTMNDRMLTPSEDQRIQQKLSDAVRGLSAAQVAEYAVMLIAVASHRAKEKGGDKAQADLL